MIHAVVITDNNSYYYNYYEIQTSTYEITFNVSCYVASYCVKKRYHSRHVTTSNNYSANYV